MPGEQLFTAHLFSDSPLEAGGVVAWVGHGRPTRHRCFRILLWNLGLGYHRMESRGWWLEGDCPVFWTQLVLSGYTFVFLSSMSTEARFSWQHDYYYLIRKDSFLLKIPAVFLADGNFCALQKLCAVIVLPVFFFFLLSIWDRKQKHK